MELSPGQVAWLKQVRRGLSLLLGGLLLNAMLLIGAPLIMVLVGQWALAGSIDAITIAAMLALAGPVVLIAFGVFAVTRVAPRSDGLIAAESWRRLARATAVMMASLYAAELLVGAFFEWRDPVNAGSSVAEDAVGWLMAAALAVTVIATATYLARLASCAADDDLARAIQRWAWVFVGSFMLWQTSAVLAAVGSTVSASAAMTILAALGALIISMCSAVLLILNLDRLRRLLSFSVVEAELATGRPPDPR